MTKRRSNRCAIPAWMADYYSNSVGGAVLESYRTGRVVTVNADRHQPRTEPRESAEILQAEAELRALNDEIDEAYWLFSRSSSRGPGRLADADLYARRNATRDRLLDLRAGR